MPISRITVGVDGSPSNPHAVDWAAEEACRRDVPLRLLHAGTSPPDVGAARSETPVFLAAACERASRHRPGVAVTVESLTRDVVPALLALDGTTQLLVLGSRGHGALTGALLGSVSLAVVSQAEFPVVVVRGDPNRRKPWGGGVVLGIGPHGTPGSVIDFAVREAALRRTSLHLVHAWQSEAETLGLPAPRADETAAQRARALVAAVVLPNPPPGVDVRRYNAPGSAGSVLLRAGADAHLLVVGAQRRSGRAGPRLGPVNHTVLHHAACPVAIVPYP
ncbi:universal stress protein [Streptacidiphilus sp. PAMC 29251]